ncbi:MAG: hypothetical protein PHC68_18775 [Syntrophorhabdaceae bacterium]|nr:hypothetical protein [Syntrophorhabdaceae bacterium]
MARWETAVRQILIEKIIADGLPVIVCFDHWDSTAAIWVKSQEDVVFDEYGSDFIMETLQRKGQASLQEITTEGLLMIIREGKHPNEPEYQGIIEETWGEIE